LRRLLCQICYALEATHQVGIIHRDLKPENIWIGRPPHGESYVKLLDFGIAKLLDPTRIHLTQTGAVLGTPLFMSPEQCMGQPVDARADIYAVGVLLYRVFTGQYPFNGTVVTELVYKHVAELPLPPSTHRPLPPDLERLILDCLAKDPAARPASAKVLGQRLDAALGAWSEISATVGTPGSAPLTGTVPAIAPPTPPDPAPPHSPKRARLRNGLLLGTGLSVAALALGGLLIQRSPSRPPTTRPTGPAPVSAAKPAAPGRASISIQNGPDNRVLLDGREIAHGQTSVELSPLAAGSLHHLVVEAPGRRRFEKDFVVEEGSSIEIPALLESEEVSPPAAAGASKTRSTAGSKAGRTPPAPLGRASVPAAVPPEPAEPTPTPSKPAQRPHTPHPTRAQERGLLEDNPLRR
jgi:serine/threonine-protein kinase